MDSKDENSVALPAWEGPAILLVDMDAFFASVEQLDHPEWRGKPVIVGGDPTKRGVVSTCSYEARTYGVRSAMPSSQAARLCPDAIWCRGDFGRYREVSRAAMNIIGNETPLVQQVSIDEAFADITPTRINREHPLIVANRIQQRICELGITCSIGLATTKSVAKIASDLDKPCGLTVVYPGTEREFMGALPVKTLSGVGKAATVKLKRLGIETLGELAEASIDDMRDVFGVRAEEMQARAQGVGDADIVVEREVKSVSHEKSFATDLTAREDIDAICMSLLSQVGRRLRLKGLKGDTLTLKMRFEDRSVHTTQTHIDQPTDDEIALRPVLLELIDRLFSPMRAVRLLGVAVSGFDHAARVVQNGLFEFADEVDTVPSFDVLASGVEDAPRANRHHRERGMLVEDEETRGRLIAAFDNLKERFGEDVVVYGGELREQGNSSGSSSKNPADYR